MYSIKLYIIKIIVIVAILQIGGLFINSASYKQLYTLVCGVILISIIFSLPDVDVDFLKVNIPEETKIVDYKYNWQKESEKKIEKLIHDDILREYNLECIVTVQTDMKTLNINISYKSKNVPPEKIYDLVQKNYCTDNDKVVVKNEN